ncbi:MAG: hypothetical protein ACI83I_002873, partial [Bacteroidia bacterium]
SKEVHQKYMEEYNTTLYKSYNSIIHGYILVTNEMLADA